MPCTGLPRHESSIEILTKAFTFRLQPSGMDQDGGRVKLLPQDVGTDAQQD